MHLMQREKSCPNSQLSRSSLSFGRTIDIQANTAAATTASCLTRRLVTKYWLILLMVQKSAYHQLRLVVCPIFLTGLYTSQVVIAGFLPPHYEPKFLSAFHKTDKNHRLKNPSGETLPMLILMVKVSIQTSMRTTPSPQPRSQRTSFPRIRRSVSTVFGNRSRIWILSAQGHFPIKWSSGLMFTFSFWFGISKK